MDSGRRSGRRVGGRAPVLLLALLTLGLGEAAWAAAATGWAVDGFSWSEATGWINFAPSHGGVVFHATHLSGFAWSESLGWIKMGSDAGGPYANTDASNWGVNVAPDGTMSGFAWSENAGWINFDSTFGQVAVDASDGRFRGFAWSQNAGWVHLANELPGYGPEIGPAAPVAPAVDVPTLSGPMLGVLVLLLGLVALRRFPPG